MPSSFDEIDALLAQHAEEKARAKEAKRTDKRKKKSKEKTREERRAEAYHPEVFDWEPSEHTLYLWSQGWSLPDSKKPRIRFSAGDMDSL